MAQAKCIVDINVSHDTFKRTFNTEKAYKRSYSNKPTQVLWGSRSLSFELNIPQINGPLVHSRHNLQQFSAKVCETKYLTFGMVINKLSNSKRIGREVSHPGFITHIDGTCTLTSCTASVTKIVHSSL